MREQIRHSGTVESVGRGMVTVRIHQSTACGSCAVRSRCGASESKEKIIDVPFPGGERLSIGDDVDIVSTERVAMTAVLLAFVFPFLLLLICIFTTFVLSGGNELASTLVGLGSLIPYYLIIYIVREKIGRKMAFSLELKENSLNI